MQAEVPDSRAGTRTIFDGLPPFRPITLTRQDALNESRSRLALCGGATGGGEDVGAKAAVLAGDRHRT